MAYNTLDWTTLIHNITIILLTLLGFFLAFYTCIAQTNFFIKSQENRRVLNRFKSKFSSFLRILQSIDITNDFINDQAQDLYYQQGRKRLQIILFLDSIKPLRESLNDVEELEWWLNNNSRNLPLSSQLYIIEKDNIHVDDLLRDDEFIREIKQNIKILAENRSFFHRHFQDKMFVYVNNQITIKKRGLMHGLFEYNLYINNVHR